MAYTLDQLRVLVAVAEELHFGKAAERLRMTQPPLSRQIQKLERAVGAQLLERDSRRVALTAAGEAFLGEARRMLALADAAPEVARRISAGSSGVLRLGFTAASTFGVLGDLLNRISAELPDLDLELAELVTSEQLAAIAAEELDLGLARPPFDAAVFGSRLLHREPLVVAVPAGHRFTRLARPVRPADVVGEPLVMHAPDRARYFHDLVAGMLTGQHLDVVHWVSQVTTMVWLVAAGRGLAFVPASAARLGVPGVAYLPPAAPARVELHLVWPLRSRNPALPRVLDVLAGDEPMP